MLTFLDQLDEEQIANAEMVARAAKRAGVDPNLAVAIAFKESSLRANPPRGSSGEIGIMQVMPGTGRGMGFNEKQLGNLESNIEAGIKYLKQGLEATGNDPKLAAVYYNGGPGAIQALTSGKDPDKRVVEYVRAINGFGTFGKPEQPAQPPSQQPPQQPPQQPLQEPAAQAPAVMPVESDADRNARIQQTIDETNAAQDRRMGQIYGGSVGAGVSAGRMLGKAGSNVIQGAAQAAGRGLQAGLGQPPGTPAGAPPAPSGGLPQPPAGAPAGAPGPTQLGVPGTYAAATGPGSATFNYARAVGLPEIEAGKALGYGKGVGETWDLMQKRQQALIDIQQRFPGDRYVENPRFGGIMTPDQGAGGGPRAQFVQPEQTALRLTPRGGAAPGAMVPLPPTQPIPTTPPAPTGLQAVTAELRALARPVVGALGTVARYAGPPAGLALAGGEAADVYNEMKKEDPDYIKALLSGITGASGVAALFPPATLPAAVIGGTAGMANYLRGRQSQEIPPSIEYTAP